MDGPFVYRLPSGDFRHHSIRPHRPRGTGASAARPLAALGQGLVALFAMFFLATLFVPAQVFAADVGSVRGIVRIAYAHTSNKWQATRSVDQLPAGNAAVSGLCARWFHAGEWDAVFVGTVPRSGPYADVDAGASPSLRYPYSFRELPLRQRFGFRPRSTFGRSQRSPAPYSRICRPD